jgi:hypothetical protein
MNVNINLTAEEVHIGDLLRLAGYGKADPEDPILTVDGFIEFVVKAYIASQRSNIVHQRRHSLTEAQIDASCGNTIATMESL